MPKGLPAAILPASQSLVLWYLVGPSVCLFPKVAWDLSFWFCLGAAWDWESQARNTRFLPYFFLLFLFLCFFACLFVSIKQGLL